MTLSELAAYVCLKVGQTDTESVAACKQFIAARYRMVWDAGLWAHSQALVTVTAATGDPGLVEFTENVSRVLRLRNVGTETNVLGTSIGTIFDYDSSLFSQTGTEAKFVHVKARPVPFARGVGVVTFNATNVSGDNDSATLEVVGGNGSGGILRETVTVPLTGQGEETTIDFTGKTGADLDNAGVGRAFIVYASLTEILGVYFSLSGTTPPPSLSVTTYVGVATQPGDDASTLAAAAADVIGPYMGASADGATLTLTANEAGPLTDASDFDTSLSITVTEQGSLGSTTSTETSFDELYFITSEESQPDIPFTNEDDEELGTFAGTVFPSDSTAQIVNVERVRVYPVPSTVQTYLAHVKTKHTDLDEDESEPELAGIDNVLLALAHADMLERMRQYAKAALKMKEAETLMREMLDLETNQQAYECRIIPADVHGSWDADGSGFSGKTYW